MRTFLILAAVGSAGCSEYAASLQPGGADADNESIADTGDDDGSSDTADADPFVASWYSLQAGVSVVEGVPVVDGASVALLLLDAELVAADTACALATDDLVVAEAPAPIDGPELFAWWQLPVAGACVPAGAPGTLGFGIGELSPEVRARLGTVELEDEADRLYGAWLDAGDGDPFPFGYAQGTGGFDSASALDGSYTLSPLLLVALGG